MELNDTYLHRGLRKKLVETIERKGITDKRILDAIGKIPRHLFLQDSALLKHAYEDKAFPIGCEQTISQPYTVAFQTELLKLEAGHKVLEVGTGSGYQACVLIEMGVKVFTIERQKILYRRTKAFLPTLGYNAQFFYGDGYKGLPTFAPFDRIIITAGAPFIPEDLLEQLAVGGIMVVPIGKNDTQIMTTVFRKDETHFVKKEHGYFSFVPLLNNKT